MRKEVLEEFMEYIKEMIPSYSKLKKQILRDELNTTVAELELAKKIVESYRKDVFLISKNAIEELRDLQTEAIMNDIEIGGICKWLVCKTLVGRSIFMISILDTICQSDNYAVNPYRSYNPSTNDLAHAMNEVISGKYQGFSILHSHPTDTFVSCQDLDTKIFADLYDSLELMSIFRNILWMTASKYEVEYMYKMYSYLLDIMIMGGVSHEAVLFSNCYETCGSIVVIYNNPEYIYKGILRNLHDYLYDYVHGVKLPQDTGSWETYKRLLDYYSEKCFNPCKFTAFTVIEQFRRKINEEEIIGYRFTRL